MELNERADQIVDGDGCVRVESQSKYSSELSVEAVAVGPP